MSSLGTNGTNEKPSPSILRGGPMTKGVAVLLGVIIVLSLVSFLSYMQMRDYHDAKYRAQYWIVSDMISEMKEVSNGLHNYTLDGVTNEQRNQSEPVLSAMLSHLGSSSRYLAAMYYDDHEKRDVFGHVSYAFSYVEGRLHYYDQGWTLSYWKAKLDGCASNISALAMEFEKGVDPSRNAIDEPYSLVNRMDLDEINRIAVRMAPQIVY